MSCEVIIGNTAYGTTNADAGVGIGLKKWDFEIWQTNNELADKAINSLKVILIDRK